MSVRMLMVVVVAAALLVESLASSNEMGPYSSHGCESPRTISMSCPQPTDPRDASYIRISNSTYGQYADSNCDVSCCQPDDEKDCEVAVEILRHDDWDDIINTCNMTHKSCSFDALMDNNMFGHCPSPSVSNFQVIYYACVYDDGNLPTSLAPTPSTTTTTTTESTPSVTTEPSSVFPPSTTNDPGGSTNIGAVIGGVLGAVCIIAIVVVIIFICIRRKQDQKASPNRSVHNGAIPRNETIVYDNAGYDEEMVIPGKRQIRSLSKADSVKYENVDVGKNSESRLSGNSARNISDNDNEKQGIYENVQVKVESPTSATNNVNRAAADKTRDETEKNGSLQNVSEPKHKHRFDKKEPTSSSNKGHKAAVVKKATPSTNLNKAASAIDVSTQPKLDKSGKHKRSAPSLGSELSVAVDIEALKASGRQLEGTKAKSVSAHELRRRSTEGSGDEDLKSIPEEQEDKVE